MADTPSEGGEQPAAPKRARRPRATPAEGAAPKPRTRRAKPAPETTTDKVKRTARSAVDGASRTAARAEKAVTKVARTTRSKVEKAAEPVANRKVALGAAAAVGVAAGLAAAFVGRKKIARAAGDVVDTVSEKVSDLKQGSGPDDASTSARHGQ